MEDLFSKYQEEMWFVKIVFAAAAAGIVFDFLDAAWIPTYLFIRQSA